ncbi:helix-turn-helix domain-containing protein [Micromonospora sp. NPDC050980]|uniref:helix-turn-helix domain-containing protein n=1 Tax=Micromonospora sp. NPDC050980 TaxID=3155161 RepID=UPI0033DB01A8
MSLLRRVIGGVLRRIRQRQGRTLREVAQAAGVSLPYLSEVERGRKEASSEVLAAICRALGIHLADLLEEARDELRRERPTPVRSAVPLARIDRAPATRGGPPLRVGPPRLHATRRPAGPNAPHLARPITPAAPHATRPAAPVPLFGGELRPLGPAPTPVGPPLRHGAPELIGTGTRIWLIPTPIVRPRPRTSPALARRRARAAGRRPVAA